MKFSVICLTYKRPELLEEAVYSVLQQTEKSWELLIINDFSDQTIVFNHPQVRIFNIKNKFKTIADKRNFGVSNSIGDLILQLDDDDFLLPSYLENLKNAIGDADWLCAQRPILYFNDPSKICLSPVAQCNSFIYKRKTVGQTVHYESSITDEGITLNEFYQRTLQFRGKLQHTLLKPNECGHVWRQDITSQRKYSLAKFIDSKMPIDEQFKILNELESPKGEIVLSPKWNADYINIIKNNIRIIDPLLAYKTIKNGEDLYKMVNSMVEVFKKEGAQGLTKYTLPLSSSVDNSWQKVKPSWETAAKLVEAVKSRGIVSTTLDVLGIDKTLGERVSEKIFQKRKLSCFGDMSKGIAPCKQLRTIPNKGSYCSSCGCGAKELARLDADISDEYTKLHYPYLECPLKRSGFSNEEQGQYLTTSTDIPFSIIIPVLNDNEELNLTIDSIYDNSPANVEVIVIDDASDVPVIIDDTRVKLHRFSQRKGAGQARHFGALQAQSKHLLFIDSHMRFDKDWFNNAITRVSESPKTLWCGSCLGLDAKHMDINHPVGIYTGADFVFHKNGTIFDGVWRPDIKDKDDYEISCVMGACYFVHKDWYFYIKGLEQTMMWGSEEPILSLKTWLAGGEVRLMKSVKLAHKFRNEASYSTNVSHIYYNKLAYMYMLLPEELNSRLKEKFSKDGNFTAAMKLVENNKLHLDAEKNYYKSIFTKDISWFCEKFQIELP